MKKTIIILAMLVAVNSAKAQTTKEEPKEPVKVERTKEEKKQRRKNTWKIVGLVGKTAIAVLVLSVVISMDGNK